MESNNKPFTFKIVTMKSPQSMDDFHVNIEMWIISMISVTLGAKAHILTYTSTHVYNW